MTLRLMTPLEIENVLSSISSFRLKKTERNLHDEFVFEALRDNLRESLKAQEIYDNPESLTIMKSILREKFICSANARFNIFNIVNGELIFKDFNEGLNICVLNKRF